MTTYLQAINKVLTRLRHDSVADLSESYTGLIGSFVNQAKEEIEDMGPWQALRTAVPVNTVAAAPTAVLTGTNERSYILRLQGVEQAFETTSGNPGRIRVVSVEQMRAMKALQPAVANQRPNFVSFSKSSAGLTATFFPTPNAVYNYSFTCVVPQAELTAVGDALTIPARPVWMLALAYALKERGEELGSDYATVRGEAQNAISDARLTDFDSEAGTFTPD